MKEFIEAYKIGFMRGIKNSGTTLVLMFCGILIVGVFFSILVIGLLLFGKQGIFISLPVALLVFVALFSPLVEVVSSKEVYGTWKPKSWDE